MLSTRSLRPALAAAALLPALPAQGFLPFGSSVGGGLDVVVNVSFASPVMMPDGSMVTSLDIDGHGRIGPGGTIGLPDFSPTTTEFAAGPPLVAALWNDLDDSDFGADQIWFNGSIPGVAVVTWVDVVESFTSNGPATIQAQIDAMGQVTLVWSSGVEGFEFGGIVGLTPGGGAVLPVETDLSAAYTMGVVVAGSAGSVFEEFDGEFAGDDVDLADGSLTFVPDGSGGFVITGLQTLAEVRQGRAACTEEPGVTYLPSPPGYIAIPGASYDRSFRSGVDLGLFDESLSTVQTLPFPFTMPGGTVTSGIVVSDNGRIVDSAGLAGTDFTPTVAEFLAEPAPQIAPLWTDLDSGLGRVWFHDLVSSVSITWDGVPQFFGVNEHTFQVQLFPDGSIQVVYANVDLEVGIEDVLVGLSPGFGAADPEGASDLSSIGSGGVVSSADGVLYEFFDQITSDNFDLDDAVSPNAGVQLVAVALPAVGSTFSVDLVDDLGTATGAVYFFGFPTGILSGPIGLGLLNPALARCELLTDIVSPGAVLAAPAGTPGTPTPLFAIPASPALVGIEGLVVSALVIDPSRTPRLFPTDEIVTRIGN
jgi:hypothetical protein